MGRCGVTDKKIHIQEDKLIAETNPVYAYWSDTTLDIELLTNVDVAVEVQEYGEWLQYTGQRAGKPGYKVFSFSVDVLVDIDEPRMAQVVFSNAESGLSQTVTVYQSDVLTVNLREGESLFDKTASYDKSAVKKLKVNGHLTPEETVQIKTEFTNLEELDIQFTDLVALPNKAFEGYSSLTFTTLPDNLQSIGNEAFKQCTNLEDLYTPDSVQSFGSEAFSECYNIRNVYIPSGVVQLPLGLFYKCQSLTSITLPEGLNDIGVSVFEGCTLLGSINIPSTVTTIRAEAFQDCKALTTMTLPESVNHLGQMTFAGCTLLESINIPNGVNSISPWLFDGCQSLASITIPEGVTTIGQNSFANCRSLTEIIIPDSVTSIGSYTFNNCTTLEHIYCKPTTPPSLAVEYSFSPNSTIHVPNASYENYINDVKWSVYASQIEGYDFE